MGLQLIRGIGESQLNAKVDLKAEDGVTWTIRFKDDLYYARV